VFSGVSVSESVQECVSEERERVVLLFVCFLCFDQFNLTYEGQSEITSIFCCFEHLFEFF